jgi:hypothetical protein
VEYLGEFESIFETTLDHISAGQLPTFGEVILDRKISRYCPLKILKIKNKLYPLNWLYENDFETFMFLKAFFR